VSAELPGDEEIRLRAAEILTRDEYAAFRADLASWRAFFDWLQGFGEWIEGLRLESPALFWLWMGGLLLVAGVLLFHAGWTLRAALRAPEPTQDEESGRVPVADLLAEARSLADRGAFLDAARHVQLATLEGLLERGVIHLGRADPNRVLRRELRKAPLAESDRQSLLAALGALERSLFRERREDPSLYSRWLELHERLVGRPPAVAS